jgi:hypothetical protein
VRAEDVDSKRVLWGFLAVLGLLVVLLAFGYRLWWPAPIDDDPGPVPVAVETPPAVSKSPAPEAESAPASAAAESNRLSTDPDLDSTRSIALTGFVRLPNGTRVVGARVSAFSFGGRDDPRPTSRPIGGSRPASAGGSPLAQATTDSEGVFTFPRIPWRAFILVAESPEGAPAVVVFDRTWLLPQPMRLGPIGLTLEAGIAIEGTLVPTDPNFLSDPTLVVTYELMRRLPTGELAWCDFGEAMGAAVQPAPSGQFTLRGVARPAEGSLHLIARGESSIGILEIPTDPWPPPAVVIPLAARSVLVGTVVGPDDQPIAGAKLGFGRERATSDPSGKFALRLDPRDAAAPDSIVASADGFAWAFLPEDFHEPLETPRIVRLERGQSVDGFVRTAAGAPAAGAIVSIEGERLLPGRLTTPRADRAHTLTRLHEIESRRVRAGADGSFRIPNLPAEPLLLSARWAGLPASITPHESHPPESGVVLTLPNPPEGFGAIDGRVIERATRQPITNFRAFVTTDYGVLGAINAGDGRFRLERCPVGRWKLRVVPGAGAPFTPFERILTVDPNQTDREISVEVAGRGRVAIHVQGQPHESTENLAILLSPLEGPGVRDAPLEPAVVKGGVATLDDVSPGQYALAVVSGGFALAQPARVRVETGRTVEVSVSLVLGRPLFVVVSSRDGEATLAPYGVRIRDAAGGNVVFDRRPGITRELSGSGVSVVLAPGSYVVTLDRADQTIADQSVALPAPGDGAFARFDISADDRK